jgi:hypothetical protein
MNAPIVSARSGNPIVLGADLVVRINEENVTETFRLLQNGAETGQILLTTPARLNPTDELLLDLAAVQNTTTDETIDASEHTVRLIEQVAFMRNARTEIIESADSHPVAVLTGTVGSDDVTQTITVIGEDGVTLEKIQTGAGSQFAVFNPSNHELGEYTLKSNQGGETTLNIKSLELTATVDETTAILTQGLSGRVTAAVNTSRDITLALTDETETTVMNTTAEIRPDGIGSFMFEPASLSTLTPGAYTVVGTDIETGVQTQSDIVNLQRNTNATATFTRSIHTGTRGDIVSIPIRVGVNQTATVRIGKSSDTDTDTNADNSDNEYVHSTAVIHDRNGDGIITPRINTYAANQQALDDDTAGSVFIIGDETETQVRAGDGNISESNIDTDVILSEDIGYDTADATETAVESELIFSSGQHKLTVWNYTHGMRHPNDTATLQLNPPTIERFRSYTAPAGTQTRTLTGLNTITETNQSISSEIVAQGDIIIYELIASGLSGRLESAETSPARAFRALVSDPDDSYRVSIAMRTDAKTNLENSSINIQSSEDIWVVTDSANDTYYLGMRVPSDIDQKSLSVRNTTESNSTIESDYPQKELLTTVSLHNQLTESNSTTKQILTNVLPGYVQIDPGLSVLPAPQQSITGTTTVAPGTQISIHLRSNNSQSAFNQTVIATVGSTGTWEMLINASSMTPDTSFTLQSIDTRPGVETIEGYAIGYVRTDAQSGETPNETTADTKSSTGGGGGGRIASVISRLFGDDVDDGRGQGQSEEKTPSQSETERTTEETTLGNPQAVVGNLADAVLGTVVENVVRSSLLGRLSRPAAIAVGALLTIAVALLYRRH